jgi:UDP-2,3-diacylglucosamine pyrophosphatase LpxH
MGETPPESAARQRAVFVSDFHLGFHGANAAALLSFLRSVETETLYLVGDIIDLSCASSALAWPVAHHEVLREVLEMSDHGTRVVYIPGNHDCLVRDLAGTDFGHVEIRREVVHEAADGRRFLVLHGDEFDHGAHPWLDALGGKAYGALLGLNKQLNRVSAPLGLPHWSIAASLKQKVKTSIGLRRDFYAAVRDAVMERRLDGLICGHLHRPEIRDLDGVLYCNDGDWVESCTALVEGSDGQLELVDWRAPHAAAVRCTGGAASEFVEQAA